MTPSVHADPLATRFDPPIDAGPTVMTVLGPVPVSELGVILPHEHLLCRLYVPPDVVRGEQFDRPLTLANLGWVRQNWSGNADNVRLTSEHLAIAELARFRDAGGGTLVDVTLDGIGRDARALGRISRATGVHIVMGTGAYVGPTHPDWVRTASVDELAAAMIDEAGRGVGTTAMRPGIIGELGCWWPLQPAELRVLQAGARAQQATGLAISIHPGRDRVAPLEIIGLLAAAGADLGRVAIGHLDRTVQDLPGLLDIARQGVYLEFDLFGLETSFYPWSGVPELLSDAQRLNLVRGLIDAGFGDRILLSHDICTKHRLARYGGHGYDHLLTNVRPWMKTRGFEDGEVTRLLATNPATLLGGGS